MARAWVNGPVLFCFSVFPTVLMLNTCYLWLEHFTVLCVVRQNVGAGASPCPRSSSAPAASPTGPGAGTPFRRWRLNPAAAQWLEPGTRRPSASRPHASWRCHCSRRVTVVLSETAPPTPGADSETTPPALNWGIWCGRNKGGGGASPGRVLALREELGAPQAATRKRRS